LPLVDREIQILGLIARGGSYAEIAAELYLAHATVKNYAASSIKKLGARSQAHAVLLACRAGLLDGRPQRHGDHAGFIAHTRRGETPCDDCAQGETAYQAERRHARRQQQAA
jgi:DNA-binding CsgD family transcriptional regulator